MSFSSFVIFPHKVAGEDFDYTTVAAMLLTVWLASSFVIGCTLVAMESAALQGGTGSKRNTRLLLFFLLLPCAVHAGQPS
jgi:hypothetical protein